MMRSIALAGSLLLAAASAAVAQNPGFASRHGDVALTYQRVQSNTPPGECGCFGTNGGSLSGSWNFHPAWAGVADVSATYQGNGPSTGNSLTLVSYMAGVRYSILHAGRFQPFGQILAGAAHAGGGIAGAGDHASTFAARVGGALDYPINERLAVRIVQIDYFPTTFGNTVNDHQNNLLLGAGIVLHWSR